MDCKTLEHILEVFGAPLSEEQAWAICFLSVSCLEQKWKTDKDKCIPFSGVQTVEILSDGSVQRCQAVTPIDDTITESQLVESVGVVIFQALDYGLDEAEEHKLSPDLEQLIETMTEPRAGGGDERSDEGDEGIENDVEDDVSGRAGRQLYFSDVLRICIENSRMSAKDAAAHHKAVCRAIFTECEELETFLEKMAREKQRRLEQVGDDDVDGPEPLEQMKSADWARLWVQMMRELREGVDLRKVDHSACQHPHEFELTPYEILMEDIRFRRYTLNKIMVEGNAPLQTRKDVHSIILEFIRSRPPLHPVTRRSLAMAPERTVGVREQVLRAIRSEPRLRPTPVPQKAAQPTRLDSLESEPKPSRKIIKPDIMLFESEDELTSEDDEDDDHDDSMDGSAFDDKNRVSPSPMTPFSPLSPTIGDPAVWKQSVDDDALQLADKHDRSDDGRRHSTSLCGSSVGATTPSTARRNQQDAVPVLSSIECLSLTVEEVMHIRSVLTKAELESLLVDAELHQLVEKGKVCFVCKIAKFSLFGSWSTQCRFCKRYVCSKCVSKMRIPTDHFEHVPVCTLSPSPLSTPDSMFQFNLAERLASKAKQPTPSSLSTSGSEKSPRSSDSSPSTSSQGNAPSAASDLLHDLTSHPIDRLKELARQGANLALSHATDRDATAESSLPSRTSRAKRAPLDRSATIAAPSQAAKSGGSGKDGTSHGPSMSICRECKAMVLRIIEASRSAQAQLASGEVTQKVAARNFHLDLKPVYHTGIASKIGSALKSKK